MCELLRRCYIVFVKYDSGIDCDRARAGCVFVRVRAGVHGVEQRAWAVLALGARLGALTGGMQQGRADEQPGLNEGRKPAERDKRKRAR